jgi:hypothetical protein
MGAIDAAWRRNKTLPFLAGFRYQRKANPRVSGTPTLGVAQSAMVYGLFPERRKMWSSAFAKRSPWQVD